MKLIGETKNQEEQITLDAVSIACNIEELDKIIQFLTETRDDLVQTPNYSFNEVLKLGEDTICPHRHMRLWNKKWGKENPDIIINIPFKAHKKKNGNVVWKDYTVFDDLK